MNPVERWNRIGKPSEDARLERLRNGWGSADTSWLNSDDAQMDSLRFKNMQADIQKSHPPSLIQGHFMSALYHNDKISEQPVQPEPC